MANYKYVNKLVVNDKFGFGLSAAQLITGLILLAFIVFLDLDKYSIFIISSSLIIGTFNIINGTIGIRGCASFKKTKAPLSDAEKLLGDDD